MLNKHHATLIAIFYLMQILQNLLAEPLTLEVITENLIEAIANEKLEDQEKLQRLDKLISNAQKQMDSEVATIKRMRSELDKYNSIKHDPLFFPLNSTKLEQNINLLNQSHLIKATENSPEIIAISNRIFLSDGNYLTYEAEKGFALVPVMESNKAIQKNARQFNLESNEPQELGVIVGDKQRLIQAESVRIDSAYPSLLEFINQGGLIGKIIILSGFSVIILGLLNYRKLHEFNQLIKNPAIVKTVVFNEFNSMGNSHYSFEQKELLLSKILHEQSAKLRGTIDYIRFIATISPMLGLLGTVSGLVITFQAFNLSGSNESSIVASGISQALTTTILGLVVAVPSLLLFTLLSSKVKFIEECLEQVAFEMMLDAND